MGHADSSPGSAPLIRRLLFGMAGLFAVGLALLYVLPFLTPAPIDRSIIEGFLERTLGRPVTVTGTASYSLFPCFQVQATNIVVPSHRGSDAPEFTDVASLEFSLDPVALLANEISVESSPLNRFLSGVRTALFAEISAAPARIRYRGSAAKRQYLVAEGSLDIEAPNLRSLRNWLGPVIPSSVSGGFRATAALVANGNRLSVENIRVAVGASKAAGRLDVTIAPSGAQANGSLRISWTLPRTSSFRWIYDFLLWEWPRGGSR